MYTTHRYVAYRVTHRITGRSYVGITCQGVKRRWCEHRRNAKWGWPGLLYEAIRDFGNDAFDVEELAVALSVDDRWEIERALIAQWGTCGGGYNELPGVPRDVNDPGVPRCFTADRLPVPEERRARLRLLFKGRKDSPLTHQRKVAAQQRVLAAGGNRHMKGVRLPDEVRTQRSISRGGIGRVSYAGIEYASAALAAAAAGVAAPTMRRWIALFGRDVPFLSKERRYEMHRRSRTPLATVDCQQREACARVASSI